MKKENEAEFEYIYQIEEKIINSGGKIDRPLASHGNNGSGDGQTTQPFGDGSKTTMGPHTGGSTTQMGGGSYYSEPKKSNSVSVSLNPNEAIKSVAPLTYAREFSDKFMESLLGVINKIGELHYNDEYKIETKDLNSLLKYVPDWADDAESFMKEIASRYSSHS